MECPFFTFGVGGCHCPSLSSPVLEFPVSALEWMGEPHRKVTFAPAYPASLFEISFLFLCQISHFTVLSWKEALDAIYKFKNRNRESSDRRGSWVSLLIGGGVSPWYLT
jgi:hypothetical protein